MNVVVSDRVVRNIGKDAFIGCSNLGKVTAPLC